MRDWERVRWVLRAFVGAVMLHAGVALFARLLVYAGGPTLPLINAPWPADRISGLLLDANAFGGLTGLALVLHHFTVGTRCALLRGGWAWLAYLILAPTLLLTFSRSSWLGLCVGLAAVTLVWPRIGGRAVLRAAVPAVVLVPLILTQIPNALDLVARPSQITSRVLLGEEAILEFAPNPILGIGLGVYVDKYGIVVHNTALWFLSDLGIIGLAVFVGLVSSVAVRLIYTWGNAPTELRPLLVGLLCGHALMLGFSLGIEAFYQRHWWVILAAAGASFALAKAHHTSVPSMSGNTVRDSSFRETALLP